MIFLNIEEFTLCTKFKDSDGKIYEIHNLNYRQFFTKLFTLSQQYNDAETILNELLKEYNLPPNFVVDVFTEHTMKQAIKKFLNQCLGCKHLCSGGDGGYRPIFNFYVGTKDEGQTFYIIGSLKYYACQKQVNFNKAAARNRANNRRNKNES